MRREEYLSCLPANDRGTSRRPRGLRCPYPDPEAPARSSEIACGDTGEVSVGVVAEALAVCGVSLVDARPRTIGLEIHRGKPILCGVFGTERSSGSCGNLGHCFHRRFSSESVKSICGAVGLWGEITSLLDFSGARHVGSPTLLKHGRYSEFAARPAVEWSG